MRKQSLRRTAPARGRNGVQLRLESLESRWLLSAGSFTSAVELGRIDYQQWTVEASEPNGQWYSFTARRNGTLTAQLSSAASGTGLELVARDRAGQAVSLATGVTRLDAEVLGGSQYYVHVTGASQGTEIVLANLLTRVGTEVAFFGTAGNDQFTFATGTKQRITLNNIGYTFSANWVTTITFSGGKGTDTAVLTGAAGVETAELRPGQGLLRSAAYQASVTDTEMITVVGGGGNDAAQLYDSPGNDLFDVTPNAARFYGPGFDHRVLGFPTVSAYATAGGVDTTSFYDSPADDVFVAYPTEATLSKAEVTGAQYFNRAVGFEAVHAYAKAGGNDLAYLYDSSGDDYFAGRPLYSFLSGPGFYNRAKFFDAVYAYSYAGGFDSAYLEDSAANDSLALRPNYSRLEGPGFANRVEAFDSVYARAIAGGYDTALVVASETADDLLQVSEKMVQLLDTQGLMRAGANAFETVTVEQNNGDTSQVMPTAQSAVNVEPRAPVAINAADFFDSNSPTLGLQAAIDALPPEGGSVTIPDGTWLLRQGLVLRSNVTLRGSGQTTLVRPNRVQAALTATAQQGDTSVAVTSTAGFRVGDEILLAAYERTPSQLTIKAIEPGRIHFTTPITLPMTYTQSLSASIVNYFSLVRTPLREQQTPVSHVVIENLTLDGNLDLSSTWMRISGPGVLCLTNHSNSLVRNITVRNAFATGIVMAYGHDNRIEDSLVENSRGHGISLCQESDSQFLRNTVRRSGYQMPAGSSGDGILVNGGTDIRVEGNLTEYNAEHGLHPAGELTRGGVWTNNTSRYNGGNGFHFCWNNFGLIVTNNTLYGNVEYGIGGLGAGGDYGDRFNIISNNRIEANGFGGIVVNGGADNVIADNIFRNNSKKTPGRYSDISLSNASRTSVLDNVFEAIGQPTQKYNIEEFGTSDGNTITGNQCQANLQGGIAVRGARTVVAENQGTIVRL